VISVIDPTADSATVGNKIIRNRTALSDFI